MGPEKEKMMGEVSGKGWVIFSGDGEQDGGPALRVRTAEFYDADPADAIIPVLSDEERLKIAEVILPEGYWIITEPSFWRKEV